LAERLEEIKLQNIVTSDGHNQKKNNNNKKSINKEKCSIGVFSSNYFRGGVHAKIN